MCSINNDEETSFIEITKRKNLMLWKMLCIRIEQSHECNEIKGKTIYTYSITPRETIHNSIRYWSIQTIFNGFEKITYSLSCVRFSHFEFPKASDTIVNPSPIH